MQQSPVATTKKPRIFLFGGAKGIGYWFAIKVLLKNIDRYEVHLCDVETPVVIAPNSPFFWFRVTYSDGFISNLPEDISGRDIIILSVPVSKLEELLKHLRKHISGGPQIINFASVQNATNTAIRSHSSSECAVYGLHLLFGPGVSHPAGNNAVVTDLGDHADRREVKDFLKLLSDSGLYLEYSSAQKHDEMMQVLQVGVHFTFFAFAKYLSDQSIDFSELLKYRTLPAGFFLSFMARALSQPKLTYANIQLQDGADVARHNILSSFETLGSTLAGSRDPKTTEEVLRSISDSFRLEDLQEGVAATQAAVQAYELASRRIHDSVLTHELVGLSLATPDSDQPDIRIGYVTSEERGAINFENRLVQLNAPIHGFTFALFRNDASVENFREQGLNFKPTQVKLSKKRFRFLTQEYTLQWIRDNVARVRVSFPVKFHRFDPEILSRLKELLPLTIPSIDSVDFGKLFVGEEDLKVRAVCFVLFDGTVRTADVRSSILSAISSVATLANDDEQKEKSGKRPSK
jgi:prephenate dehydrogenase